MLQLAVPGAATPLQLSRHLAPSVHEALHGGLVQRKSQVLCEEQGQLGMPEGLLAQSAAQVAPPVHEA